MTKKVTLIAKRITTSVRIRNPQVTQRRAARDRQCCICYKKIKKGEQYINMPCSYDNFTNTFSSHLNCIQ